MVQIAIFDSNFSDQQVLQNLHAKDLNPVDKRRQNCKINEEKIVQTKVPISAAFSLHFLKVLVLKTAIESGTLYN